MSQRSKKKKWVEEQRRKSRSVSAAPQNRRKKKKKRRRLNRKGKIVVSVMFVAFLAILAGLFLLIRAAVKGISGAIANHRTQTVVEETIEETEPEPEITADPEPETEETITSFHPTSTEDTVPSKLIASTDIMVNGEILSSVSDYTSTDTISFGTGSAYTAMDGVITFRGNNFRNSPAYGLANMTEYKMETVWEQATGSSYYNGKAWNGSGWTGQPLITTWDKDVRQHMNMYDWAKEADELTEVIYATLDGNVYFMELETGEPTRDPINIGWTFKGAGALDPRGYPILYLGAGYTSNAGKARVFIVNLLDGSIMYTFGNEDSFANRNCFFFDSSPLVDAETDTLIYPGESGLLYLIHLNSNYNASAGTLTIDPDRVVKWRYDGVRSSSASYWLGMEDSAVTYEGYMFIADNGGNLMCLDLNTLQLVWAQDTLDDTNGTPVLSVENGHPYLYIGPSFHQGWRANNEAVIPIFKIDAENGSIVWQVDYTCTTIADVSGGIQSTIALGKKDLSDYIYCTVSRTGGTSRGVLTCINKSTGEIVWEHEAGYAWSSPVAVYNSDGSGHVIYADSLGQLYLIDGLTGEQKDQIQLSDGVIEASPAVYNDMLVVGIRDSKIWGVKLK